MRVLCVFLLLFLFKSFVLICARDIDITAYVLDVHIRM